MPPRPSSSQSDGSGPAPRMSHSPMTTQGTIFTSLSALITHSCKIHLFSLQFLLLKTVIINIIIGYRSIPAAIGSFTAHAQLQNEQHRSWRSATGTWFNSSRWDQPNGWWNGLRNWWDSCGSTWGLSRTVHLSTSASSHAVSAGVSDSRKFTTTAQ